MEGKQELPADIEAETCSQPVSTDEKQRCLLSETNSAYMKANYQFEDPCRNSCISDSSLDMDLECGVVDSNLNAEMAEKGCRICQLSVEKLSKEHGVPIALGCSCKGDLAIVHKNCAEKWFTIKGNKNCEVCGLVAQNMAGIGEVESSEKTVESRNEAPMASQPHSFLHGYRLLSFILTCIVLIIVLCWLFRFKAPY